MFMSASRALQIIGTGIAQKLSAVRIGKAFKDLGFKSVRVHGMRGFLVVERSAEDIHLYLENIADIG